MARRYSLRLQAGLGKQDKGLALRPLVNGDSRQLAFAIKDEGLRNTFDVILLVYGVAGMWASRLRASISIAGEGGKSRDCELGNGVDE
jgi:hypothetical protein